MGPLKLGVIPTLAPYLMPMILKPLRQSYPGLAIELWEDQTRALIEGLRNHRLDAALLATAADSPEITEIALFEEPLLAALPLDHRLAGAKTVSEEALAGELLVLADDSLGHRDIALRRLAGQSSRTIRLASRPGYPRPQALRALEKVIRAEVGAALRRRVS